MHPLHQHFIIYWNAKKVMTAADFIVSYKALNKGWPLFGLWWWIGDSIDSFTGTSLQDSVELCGSDEGMPRDGSGGQLQDGTERQMRWAGHCEALSSEWSPLEVSGPVFVATFLFPHTGSSPGEWPVVHCVMVGWMPSACLWCSWFSLFINQKIFFPRSW